MKSTSVAVAIAAVIVRTMTETRGRESSDAGNVVAGNRRSRERSVGVQVEKQKNPRGIAFECELGGSVESAGNDLLSRCKHYHWPQVLIGRVRDGNGSFHLGKITGKLPEYQ